MLLPYGTDSKLSQSRKEENLGSSVEIRVCTTSSPEEFDVNVLESAYRKALAAFKVDKTNKDLRRKRSAAKKAWDIAVAATQDGEQLNCRDCSQMFMFTVEDKEYYLKNCWSHRPSRCKGCSNANKDRLQDRSKRDSKTKYMCYAFQRGECGYGDRCKFSHDPNGKKMKDAMDLNGARKRDEKKEDRHTDLCQWETKCIPTIVCNTQKKTENISSSSHKIDELKMSKKKVTVAKAMAKALKRAPKQQLKLKELRKLIKNKLEEKNKNMSKHELKDAISDTIIASGKTFQLDGKLVILK